MEARQKGWRASFTSLTAVINGRKDTRYGKEYDAEHHDCSRYAENGHPENDNVPEMKEYLKPILFSGTDRFLQAHNWLMEHPGTEVWDVDCHEWDDMPGITLYYVAEMPADDYEALKRMKEKQKVAVKQRRADHDD